MDDRPFDAPNLLRHAAGRLHGFPDISEDLLDAADEIERLQAENRRLMDGMQLAWGIICNGRAWDPGQHDKWEAVKFRFRDDHWHPALDRNVRPYVAEQENDR